MKLFTKKEKNRKPSPKFQIDVEINAEIDLYHDLYQLYYDQYCDTSAAENENTSDFYARADEFVRKKISEITEEEIGEFIMDHFGNEETLLRNVLYEGLVNDDELTISISKVSEKSEENTANNLVIDETNQKLDDDQVLQVKSILDQIKSRFRGDGRRISDEEIIRMATQEMSDSDDMNSDDRDSLATRLMNSLSAEEKELVRARA